MDGISGAASIVSLVDMVKTMVEMGRDMKASLEMVILQLGVRGRSELGYPGLVLDVGKSGETS